MQALTILVFLGIAALFGIISALARDRRFLIGFGMFLLIFSLGMIENPGISYQTGTDVVKTNISTDTTFVNKTAVYTDVTSNYSFPVSETIYTGSIVLVIAAFLIGSNLKGMNVLELFKRSK